MALLYGIWVSVRDGNIKTTLVLEKRDHSVSHCVEIHDHLRQLDAPIQGMSTRSPTVLHRLLVYHFGLKHNLKNMSAVYVDGVEERLELSTRAYPIQTHVVLII